VTGRLTLVVLLCTAILAGCGGGAGPTPVPAATPTYTRVQSNACAVVDIALDFGGDAPSAEHVFYGLSSDVAGARKQALATAKKYAAAIAPVTGTGADVELAAVHSALVSGAAAFAKSMTLPQFEAAYSAIQDAEQAFSERCREIGSWVQQNVPQ
jgi:hypothetical protein